MFSRFFLKSVKALSRVNSPRLATSFKRGLRFLQYGGYLNYRKFNFCSKPDNQGILNKKSWIREQMEFYEHQVKKEKNHKSDGGKKAKAFHTKYWGSIIMSGVFSAVVVSIYIYNSESDKEHETLRELATRTKFEQLQSIVDKMQLEDYIEKPPFEISRDRVVSELVLCIKKHLMAPQREVLLVEDYKSMGKSFLFRKAAMQLDKDLKPHNYKVIYLNCEGGLAGALRKLGVKIHNGSEIEALSLFMDLCYSYARAAKILVILIDSPGGMYHRPEAQTIVRELKDILDTGKGHVFSLSSISDGKSSLKPELSEGAQFFKLGGQLDTSRLSVVYSSKVGLDFTLKQDEKMNLIKQMITSIGIYQDPKVYYSTNKTKFEQINAIGHFQKVCYEQLKHDFPNAVEEYEVRL